ncbi:hypothetical protein ANCCAN_12916 [Ancylostoma caninum]|uniref:Uncharacterized protein n=1 Tax=Ancylostoma caninum TaxID=29170 RepID=A0A368GDP8_ANCCA|nr:hypothetical protein ANCCAN_12916 [Ancylostoma caninum]
MSDKAKTRELPKAPALERKSGTRKTARFSTQSRTVVSTKLTGVTYVTIQSLKGSLQRTSAGRPRRSMDRCKRTLIIETSLRLLMPLEKMKRGVARGEHTQKTPKFTHLICQVELSVGKRIAYIGKPNRCHHLMRICRLHLRVVMMKKYAKHRTNASLKRISSDTSTDRIR